MNRHSKPRVFAGEVRRVRPQIKLALTDAELQIVLEARKVWTSKSAIWFCNASAATIDPFRREWQRHGYRRSSNELAALCRLGTL